MTPKATERLASPSALLIPVLLLLGCGSGGGGTGTGTGTSGGTTSGTGGGSDDGVDDSGGHDPVACSPSSCAVSLSQCCHDEQPAGGDGACPSLDEFPNEWSCNRDDECVNAGCDPEDVDANERDCASSLTGLTCRLVSGVGFCVAECDNDQDCVDHGMPGTQCIGDISSSSDEFCVQPAP